ncbi:hypothetical protein D3C80_977790 [compost metagenome]
MGRPGRVGHGPPVVDGHFHHLAFAGRAVRLGQQVGDRRQGTGTPEIGHGIALHVVQLVSLRIAVHQGALTVHQPLLGLGEVQQDEVFHVGCQRMADAALHCIQALAGQLYGAVADIVDVIGIVAGAADHGVLARHAIEDVVAAVADQLVVQRVAGGMDVEALHQAQLFDIGIEQVVGAADHRVVTLAGVFENDVVDAVDDVGVVALAPLHQVAAGTAIQVVVAKAAEQGVVARPTIQPVVVGLAGGEALLAFIVAGEANQEVIAGPAIEHITAYLAKEPIVAVTAVQEVMAVTALQLVIARLAEQRVIAQAAKQQVVAITTLQPVIVGFTRGEALLAVVAGSETDEDVVATPAPEHIVANLAEQAVAASLAPQVIVACASLQLIVAGAPQQVVIAFVPHQQVIVGPAVEHIVAQATVKAVRPRAAEQEIVVAFARQQRLLGLVERGEADQDVVTVTAAQRVIAYLAEQPVVTGTALQQIVPITTL